MPRIYIRMTTQPWNMKCVDPVAPYLDRVLLYFPPIDRLKGLYPAYQIVTHHDGLRIGADNLEQSFHFREITISI